MGPGRGRTLGGAVWAAVLCATLGGCSLFKPKADQSLLAHRPDAGGSERVADAYAVHFPDVLDIQIKGQPALSGERLKFLSTD